MRSFAEVFKIETTLIKNKKPKWEATKNQSERQQRTKVNNAYSIYSEILYGVPQGFILGSLLFNIYISDMFYDIDKCDIASYADDNTPYTSDFNLEEVIQKLELTTNNLVSK